MKIDHCQQHSAAPIIVVQEKGKKATFINNARHPYTQTRIDKCAQKDGLRADYVLTKKDFGCLIIELKGKNVEHAVKQVMATAEFWTTNKFCAGAIGALIVSTRVPRAGTSIQRAALDFAKRYKGNLKIVSGNRQFEFQEIFRR